MVKIFGKALAVPLLRTRALLRDFGANTRANVAIIFALSAIPVVAAIGCVVDYSYATMIKTKLQAAADAAALATVSNNSPIVVTAKSMSGNGTVSGGPTYIQNFFSADTTTFSGVSATGTTTKSGMTVTATLSYSYGVPTTFMKVLGYPTITLSGSSTASVTRGDLHQLLSDARRLRLHELPLHHCGAGEAYVGQSRQPASDKQPAQQRLSARLPVRLPLGHAEHHVPEPLEPPNQYTRPVAGIMAPGPTAVPQLDLRRLPVNGQAAIPAVIAWDS